MAQTEISWTHRRIGDRIIPGYTMNPWIGCEKVGPGCANCYAEAFNDQRLKRDLWGPHAIRQTVSDATWANPLRWNRLAEKDGIHRFVFCASWADVWDKKAPPGARERLFELVRATPWLVWLLLSKRIGNAPNMLPPFWDEIKDRCVIMATMVNQPEVDRDMRKLLAVDAGAYGISMEPMLGPIVLPQEFLDLGRRAWAIVGGESIGREHPLHPDWVRGIGNQCAAGGANGPVPFHFKQWGRWWPAAPVYPDEDPVWKRLHVTQQHGPDANPDEWVVDSSDAVDLALKRERLCAMDRDGGFSRHPTYSGEVQPPPSAGSWWFEDHGTRGARKRELDGKVHDGHPFVLAMDKEEISEASSLINFESVYPLIVGRQRF